MQSKIASSVKFKRYQPVTVILTDEKPADGVQFREDRWGCVASMLVAAGKGRVAVFDRETFGCVGGGVGLGFGDQYKSFPIEQLLSTGDGISYRDRGHRTHLAEGERYFRTPGLARKFVDSLPIREVPTEYVVFKPLAMATEADHPTLVIFLADPDQLSALMVLANYDRARSDNVIVPFGAGCHSVLFGFAEAEREIPRAVIGFSDISVRKYVERDILSLTVPWKMFLEMEGNVEGSFLEEDQWLDLLDRRLREESATR